MENGPGLKMYSLIEDGDFPAIATLVYGSSSPCFPENPNGFFSCLDSESGKALLHPFELLRLGKREDL